MFRAGPLKNQKCFCETFFNKLIPSNVVRRTAKQDALRLSPKHFSKIAVTLKKISKLPIFVQKYLINILAMLYFPFEQKLEK
jgi:hypothetical protein